MESSCNLSYTVTVDWRKSPPRTHTQDICALILGTCEYCIAVVQLLSHVRLFVIPWTARLPCPSLSPSIYSNSCLLSRWCYLSISSSVTPFSFYLQAFPASGSFPMSCLFSSGGQSIGPCIPFGNTSNQYSGLISFRTYWLDLLAIQGTLKSLLQQHSSKSSIFQRSASFMVQLSTSIHDHWKNHSFD